MSHDDSSEYSNTAGNELQRAAGGLAMIHVIVTGRVQGVGFRDFVQRRALMLGVAGWVRNQENGRAVEVEASGTRAALEQLLGHLRSGPRLGHVSDVQVEWLEEPARVDRFEIRY